MDFSIIENILLQIYDSVEFGFSYRAKKMFWLDNFPREWKKFNQKQIRDSINGLNKQKLIKKKQNYDGSTLVTLTEKGRLRALNISFRRFVDRKEKWDGKWRMVAFDIPDKCRKGRDALRYRFKSGGFYKLQESIFLYPYDCEKEIRDLVDFFKLQKYVRFGLLDYIDDEENVKVKLGIN